MKVAFRSRLYEAARNNLLSHGEELRTQRYIDKWEAEGPLNARGERNDNSWIVTIDKLEELLQIIGAIEMCLSIRGGDTTDSIIAVVEDSFLGHHPDDYFLGEFAK